MSSSQSLETVNLSFSDSIERLKSESLEDLEGLEHLEEVITKGGRRVFQLEDIDFDLYQCSGYSVDYKYYTTPFKTQLGTIDLMSVEPIVNLPDGTDLAAARPAFKNDLIRKKQLAQGIFMCCGGSTHLS